jgi:hypothetical protein
MYPFVERSSLDRRLSFGQHLQTGSVMNGTGWTVQVAFVTFLANGTFSTIGFCADQTSLFPMNQTGSVNFNPGQPCATIIAVEIIG